jgi:hypothetical protein
MFFIFHVFVLLLQQEAFNFIVVCSFRYGKGLKDMSWVSRDPVNIVEGEHVECIMQ